MIWNQLFNLTSGTLLLAIQLSQTHSAFSSAVSRSYASSVSPVHIRWYHWAQPVSQNIASSLSFTSLLQMPQGYTGSIRKSVGLLISLVPSIVSACIVVSPVVNGGTPKCWGGTLMGLARSDEPELSFLCFLWGLPGFDPLLSPSPSISSGLAPSRT